MAMRVVDTLEARDPDLLAGLVEVGIVRREWLEHPGEVAFTSAPVDVIERLLERSVERRPSLVAALGLTTIQVLSAPSSAADEEGDGHGDAALGVPTRLAVVFTDLEGFTRWTAKMGDEAASLLLAEHYRTVGPVVRSRGGRVVKRLGDGLLLTFPEPEAAVLAGLELVDSQPEPLRLRAGVHCGEVFVTRDDLVGHVVNVAARVTESCKGGQVLVTAEVRDATEGSLANVAFGPARRRSFKGVAEPVRVSLARYDHPSARSQP